MKFIKITALSVLMLTVAGAQAGIWDTISSAASSYFNQSTQPVAQPTQLGIPTAVGQTAEQNQIVAIQNNVTQIIAQVRQMVPAVTKAVTTQDFTSVLALAEPAKNVLTLGMSTAKSIQQLISTNPQDKGAVAGIIAQLNPVIKPLADQVRALANSAGFPKSFILNTIASGLEQVPTLLTTAIR